MATDKELLLTFVEMTESNYLRNLAMEILLDGHVPNWRKTLHSLIDDEKVKDQARLRFAPVYALVAEQADLAAALGELLKVSPPIRTKPN